MRLQTFAILALAAASTFPVSARADVKMIPLFSDHMVLQRGMKVPVWGTADAGEQVTITLGDAKAAATAGPDGKWKATLDSLTASDQPGTMTIAGKNTLTIKDVLVGDVWVASGQSNMEFGLRAAHNWTDEEKIANRPTLRLFLVVHDIALDPQGELAGKWQLSTPQTAGSFSAVAYFFGVDIMADQKVPVGLIGSYWGGTPAQSWTSQEALASSPETKAYADQAAQTKTNLADLKAAFENDALAKWKADDDKWHAEVGPAYNDAMKKWDAESRAAQAAGQPVSPRPAPSRPQPRKPYGPDSNPNLGTVLYNGMIAPIIPYAIKGVIWYQGESNAGAAKEYRTLFPEMITDWRARWGEGDFPFLWVQLASYHDRQPKPTDAAVGWPALREAQAMTLKLPNTGQALAIDIGEGPDIHPKNKQSVGQRLALAARHVAYGEDIVFSGPTFSSTKVDGGQIRVTFKNIGSGLTVGVAPAIRLHAPPTTMLAELKGFSIAGADRKFHWADAKIDGDSVIVHCPAVKDPVAVRYAWADNPECNLYNAEKLPACPFRTDDWDPQAPVKPAAK